MNIKPNLDRMVIGYCRVSSNKQKDDLERQIENMKLYLTAQGKPFEIISDIGSGINYKKKGLKELMKRISQNKVEKVVVLYKDRLLRFKARKLVNELIEEGEDNDKNNPSNVTT